MATPRKRWFRVADSLLREEMTRDQRSTFLGLLAWFNQRRQRDGHTGKRAQEASIPPGDLLTITLSESLSDARTCIEALRDRLDLTIEIRNAFTFVRWPNLAKFQEWNSPADGRSRARGSARRLPLPKPSPEPSPKPEPEPKKEEGESAADAAPTAPVLRLEPPPADPKPARRKREATLAPEDLEGEQLGALWARLWRAAPWLLVARMAEVSHHCHPRWVRSEVRACLAHFRGIGEKRPDWPATCASWVLKDDGREWKQQREAPPSALHFHATERAPEYVPSEVARACARAAKGAA